MNNTKAVLQAMHRKGGTQEEIDALFNSVLVKAGFQSFSLVQGPLDWLTLIGASAAMDEPLLPVLKRAYQIRFKRDKAHLPIVGDHDV
jgi:hypothetical protein